MNENRNLIRLSLALLSTVAIACWSMPFLRVFFPFLPAISRLGMYGSPFFVLAGLVGGGLRTAYGRVTLLALVFCWVGDMMAWVSFAGQVTAFSLAHFAFAAAFYVHGVTLKRCLVALLVFAAVSACLSMLLLPHIPQHHRPLVIAYMFIITGMLVVAGGTKPGPGRLLILTGAILFYLSDVLLALYKFVDNSPIFSICYVPYVSACVILALSIYARNRGEEAGECA